MNNRILARIVAAVMAIAMLGTVSFAASISGDVINVGALDADYNAQDQKTVVAYFAETADDVNPDPADIIAVYQSGEAASDIKIDTTKQTASEGDARKFLVVRYGGSGVDANAFAIALTANEAPVSINRTYSIDYGTYTKEFKDVACFTQAIPALSGGKVTSYGFKLWKDGGENTSADTPLYFTGDTVIEGDGEYSFGIVMVAIPETVTLAAESFYSVEQ